MVQDFTTGKSFIAWHFSNDNDTSYFHPPSILLILHRVMGEQGSLSQWIQGSRWCTPWMRCLLIVGQNRTWGITVARATAFIQSISFWKTYWKQTLTMWLIILLVTGVNSCKTYLRTDPFSSSTVPQWTNKLNHGHWGHTGPTKRHLFSFILRHYSPNFSFSTSSTAFLNNSSTSFIFSYAWYLSVDNYMECRVE